MSKTKKQSKIDKADYEIMNEFIDKNKQLELNTNTTPFASNLDNLKKQQLKLKLKNTIKDKNQKRHQPTKTTMKQYTDEIKQMMNHPKITPEILNLYNDAIANNITKSLPTPIEIFNDVDKYKKVYYQYILELLKKMKTDNLHLSYLDKLLDNPYGHYMSKCIECPLNPFKSI